MKASVGDLYSSGKNHATHPHSEGSYGYSYPKGSQGRPPLVHEVLDCKLWSVCVQSLKPLVTSWCVPSPWDSDHLGGTKENQRVGGQDTLQSRIIIGNYSSFMDSQSISSVPNTSCPTTIHESISWSIHIRSGSNKASGVEHRGHPLKGHVFYMDPTSSTSEKWDMTL